MRYSQSLTDFFLSFDDKPSTLFRHTKSPISNPIHTITCTVPVPGVVMSAGDVHWRRMEMEGFLHYPQLQAEQPIQYSILPGRDISSCIGILLNDCMLMAD